jgi:mycoredoxin
MSNDQEPCQGEDDDIRDVKPAGDHPGTEPAAVVLYRRDGCFVSAILSRQLRRRGVPTTELDIWADAEAAAFVRAHAGGNETVPTVEVGDTVVVNPTARQVEALAVAAGLSVVPVRRARWWRFGATRSAGNG